jgi:hypothetical protein
MDNIADLYLQDPRIKVQSTEQLFMSCETLGYNVLDLYSVCRPTQFATHMG